MKRIRFFYKSRNFIWAVLATGLLFAVDVIFNIEMMQEGVLELRYGIGEKPQLPVLPYNKIRSVIANKATTSQLEKAREEYNILLPGGLVIPLEKISQTLKNKKLNEMQLLGIESMFWGVELIREYDKNPNEKLLESLQIGTEDLLDWIEEFDLAADATKFGEHAVSERVEFFLLFRALLKNLGRNPSLQQRINRHLVHSIRLLLSDRRFVWESNHGLMQIRALLHIAASMPEAELGKESLKVAIIRIREALPYFLASDGAVLEAASGYWYYIFSLWKEIANQNILPSDIRTLIQDRIGKTKLFLETVLTCDQYLQGIGDSYSRVVDRKILQAGRRKEVFSFSNGLAGISFSNDDTCGQLLFVSLDTPPHIHKLPEDLALYLYLGEPFFRNMGVYAYDNSPGRKYVLSEKAQSTVTFLDESTPESSDITHMEVDETNSITIWRGEKRYGEEKITRNVIFDGKRGSLQIVDNSDSEKPLRTTFNISEQVKIVKQGDGRFDLQGTRHKISVTYSGKMQVKESWVAPAHMESISIKQIVFTGLKNTVLLQSAAMKTPIENNPKLSKKDSERKKLATKFRSQYKFRERAQQNSPRLFVTIRELLLGVFVLSLALFPLRKTRGMSVLMLLGVDTLLILDLLLQYPFLAVIVRSIQQIVLVN